MIEHSATLDKYLKDVDALYRRYNLPENGYLHPEITEKLFYKYKNDGDILARNTLIYSLLRLVFKYTSIFFNKKNNNRGFDCDDIIGYANTILIECLDKYDPKKGTLPSYARNWVQNKMKVLVKEQSGLIRVPHNRITDQKQYNTMKNKFEIINGYSPSDGETMEYTKKTINPDGTEEYALDIYEFNTPDCYEVMSGNQTIDENTDTEFFDIIQSEYDESFDFDLSFDVKNINLQTAIQTLDESEQQLIKLAFYNEMSLIDIPYSLPPNTANEKNQLEYSSKNEVTISIEFDDQNNSTESIQYLIKHNTHISNSEENICIGNKIHPITHHFSNITSNKKTDHFIFDVKNAKKISILHTHCGKAKEIQYKYTGGKLSFDIVYGCGFICTSMTCRNKIQKILQKLRIKMI